ncbi:hypothetical protein [Chryseobacterium sp. Leaf180]|uniref:hypothetical protein n=1 Tax=Chryseobacterium sp. Leaf180 TaxID=1736289 RepID=UPI0012FF1AB3|nr:hypothetical protein [Chryseobacterium sp. Leaf180]
MKHIISLLAIHASAVSFTHYYNEIWDLPSVVSLGSLVASSGYLITSMIYFRS